MDELTVRAPGAGYYPDGWSKWSDLVRSGAKPPDLGFNCLQSHLNRFAARFRIARAFQGVHIVGYNDDVQFGYSGLFRLFLTCTAFEQYLKAIPSRQDDCLLWLGKYSPADLITQVREVDVRNKLYGLVAAKTHKDTKAKIVAYLSGEAINWTYLASSLRHLFAHGILTPSANGSEPRAVGRICDLLSPVLLHGVNEDFTSRLSAFTMRETTPYNA